MSHAKYGCHNRAPFAEKLQVQSGWAPTWGSVSRTPLMKEIPFRNERACVYTTSDLGKVDPKCNGCRWAGGLLQAAEVAGAC